MKLPELIPENHQLIYEYFGNFEPSQRIQKIGFAVMHCLYGSEVHYEGSASTIISEHLSNNGRAILSPNHQSNADTPTVAGLVYEKPFELLRNTTIIPAKAEMFDWPLIGKFFPHMLAHPAFRGKNFSHDEAGKELRSEVTDNLIQFNIDYINNGGNVAIFSEATRNKNNPQEVQELRQGIARIALGVKRPADLLIITPGIAYKHPRLKLSPLVVVPEPFCPDGMSQQEVLKVTRDRMQKATTQAFDLAA